MNLSDLTEIFVNLESTSSRNEMTEILANFFKTLTEKGELHIIVNLLSGRSDLDKLGVGESMILDSLIPITGYSKDLLKNGVVKFGDAGSLAEEVLSKKIQTSIFKKTRELTIKEAHDNIHQLGEIKGYKAKINHLSGFLNAISATSAKYVIRIILGILRLGLSTQTILDALAVGIAGDKKHKEKIENAYNVMDNIGDVAVKLQEEGIDVIENIDASYNMPIRPMLASRLKFDEIFEKMEERFFAENKLDGERAQIHITFEIIQEKTPEKEEKIKKYVKIFSRQLTDITHQYPDIVRYVLQNINVREAILDGEIVGYRDGKLLAFQELMQRKRKHEIQELVKKVPAKLYLFDILKLGEKSQFDTPYILRKDILAGIFNDDPDEIEFVQNREILNKGQLIDFFQRAQTAGYEGVVLKNAKSKYSPGKRGNDWVKLKGLEGAKMVDTLDLVIIGGYHGMGRRKEMAGSFLCAMKDGDRLVALTNIGSGFTDEQISDISKITESLMIQAKPTSVFSLEVPDVWIEPRIVIEVMADEIMYKNFNGNDVYSIRFPVFARVREDKTPDDITTLKEVMELYQKQQ